MNLQQPTSVTSRWTQAAPRRSAAHTPPQAGDILSQIGNTPLLDLNHFARGLGVSPHVGVYAKAEWFNPSGSVKARAALRILQESERTGQLYPGRILIDSSSGNTGIAFALIGAVKGYEVHLVMPANVSAERKALARAYGAKLIESDPLEGSDGAILMVRELVAAHPDRYFYANQYNNPANWQAHFNTTGVEILEQTGGRITHFIAALGTSGTFMGTTRRLRQDKPGVTCISAQPATGFHGLEGLKHMPTAIVPAIYDPALADENLWMETEDAYKMVLRLAREEGLLVGISAGANVLAALQVGRRLAAEGREGVIVTVLCDSASKYLTEPFWNE